MDYSYCIIVLIIVFPYFIYIVIKFYVKVVCCFTFTDTTMRRLKITNIY